mmetsp:Transcript_51913/g.112880  ORF Transcript_51913/g.112880 Transcript_51913/m.112880 type:complete len:422 (+) Transcript_51913:227-1492(+)
MEVDTAPRKPTCKQGTLSWHPRQVCCRTVWQPLPLPLLSLWGAPDIWAGPRPSKSLPLKRRSSSSSTGHRRIQHQKRRRRTRRRMGRLRRRRRRKVRRNHPEEQQYTQPTKHPIPTIDSRKKRATKAKSMMGMRSRPLHDRRLVTSIIMVKGKTQSQRLVMVRTTRTTLKLSQRPIRGDPTPLPSLKLPLRMTMTMEMTMLPQRMKRMGSTKVSTTSIKIIERNSSRRMRRWRRQTQTIRKSAKSQPRSRSSRSRRKPMTMMNTTKTTLKADPPLSQTGLLLLPGMVALSPREAPCSSPSQNSPSQLKWCRTSMSRTSARTPSARRTKLPKGKVTSSVTSLKPKVVVEVVMVLVVVWQLMEVMCPQLRLTRWCQKMISKMTSKMPTTKRRKRKNTITGKAQKVARILAVQRPRKTVLLCIR